MYSVGKAQALSLVSQRPPEKFSVFKVSQGRRQGRAQQLAAPLVLLLLLAVLLVQRCQRVRLLVLKERRATSLASVFPLAPPMVNLHLLARLTVKVLVMAAALVVRHLMAALLVFRFRQVRHRVHLMGHRHRHRLSLRLSQVTRRFSNMCNHADQDHNNHNRQGTQAGHKDTHGRGQRLLAPVVTPAKSTA
jgi:hypothetical protein